MKFLLTKEERHILSQMINKELQMIYSHKLSYNMKENIHEILETVVFRIDKGFVLLESRECEIDHEEYYKLMVKESLFAGNLPYEKTDDGGGLFTEPVSSISVWAKVKCVSIYKQEKNIADHKITYIAGIKIELDNRKILYFTPYFLGFKLIYEEDKIEKETKLLTLIEQYN